MSLYNRMSLVISLTLLGIIVASLVDLPPRTLSFVALGSPVSLSLSTFGVVAALVVAATCAGTDALVRTHPKALGARLRFTLSFWILPSLLAIATLSVVPPLFGHKLYWLIGLGATYLGLALVLLAEYYAVDPAGPYYGQARLGLNLLTYAAAFALYAIIYAPRARSLLSATAVVIVTIPLALELLRSTEERIGRTWLHGLTAALIMGEITWGLNYWELDGLSGGLFLLLAFYVVTGLIQQHLLGRLTRRVTAEYVLTAGVGLAVMLGLGGRLQ
jgi:hypothetical protein